MSAAAASFDLIVIGSGFGGAVTACRAAQAGLRVVVLERGRRMSAGAYDALARGEAPLLRLRGRDGLLEPHVGRELTCLTASAVGGGSHVYTAVTVPARPEVFDDRWPAGLRAAELSPHFDRVVRTIEPSPLPHPILRSIAVDTLASRLGAASSRLPLSMEWPSDATDTMQPNHRAGGDPLAQWRSELVTWLRGGPVARKRPLDATYLRLAEAAGAVIRPCHEATAVAPSRSGYRVGFRRHASDHNDEGVVTAPRVVVAAGTLNTVRLLLTCRDRLGTLPRLSRALGRRFFTNGDLGAVLVGPRVPIGPDAGPPVTGWIDLWRDHRLFLMETGPSPVAADQLHRLLGPLLWLRDVGRKYADPCPVPCEYPCGSPCRIPGPPAPASRYAWSYAAMGYDDSPGTLTLNRRGRLTFVHGEPQDESFSAARTACLTGLAEAAGAMLLAPPPEVARRRPVTVHPLGGAALAGSPDRGVVDPFGEVFGYPGLYVADGALAPTPFGCPPSMTIAALAEHVAANMVRAC